MQQWDAADESSGSSPNFPPKFYGSASGGVPGSGDEPPGQYYLSISRKKLTLHIRRTSTISGQIDSVVLKIQVSG